MQTTSTPACGEDTERIEELRSRIDEVDRAIVTHLVERARLAHAVGVAKGGTAVYRPERERAVINKAVETARTLGSLVPEESVAALYQEIIAACRAVEGKPRVAYLGPCGTFTEMAVLKQFGHACDLVPCESIDAVFHSLESEKVDFAVVPVENNTQGSVTRTLDLLFGTNQSIIAEVYVPVRHNLMNRSGRLEDIECVMAHPQALAQCRGWLAAHLPSVRIESRASNAEAAVQASRDPKVAAIASSRAAELYDLTVVAAAVQDEPRNRTRFVVLGAKTEGRTANVATKTSLVFSVNNTAGSLFKALEPLSVHGVSMTKLESRPSRHGAWEYNFYVDLEGHERDDNVARALADIAGMATYLKVLGSYPMADDL